MVLFLFFVASSTISVSFDTLETADNENGCRDFLQFFDGDSDRATPLPLSGKNRICGSTAPSGTITSTSNFMFITFRSDRSGSALGFQITVTHSSARKRRDVANEPQELLTGPSVEKRRRAKRFAQKKAKRLRRAAANVDLDSKLQKRSTNEDDYDDSYNYDSASFWDNYDQWYNNLDPYAHFPSDLEAHDWMTVYIDSKKPDYADLREFALFTINEMKWFGTQAVDFIAQCTFDGRDCDHEAFEVFQNPKFGNCFVFNSILNQSMVNGEFKSIRSTSKTGQEYGLKLTLFTNTEEYIGVLSQQIGAQVRLSNSAKS